MIRAVLANFGWALVKLDHYCGLRRALNDAILTCDRCKGHGKLYIAGGVVTCPRCSAWKQAL